MKQKIQKMNGLKVYSITNKKYLKIYLKYKLIGVRTFYFKADHHRGPPTLFINNMHDYSESVLATKQEMNRYFTENYYHALVGMLSEY